MVVLIREVFFLNCRADPRKTRISVWEKSGAERGLSPRAGEAQ